jgi:hypothetical protein
MNTLHKRFVFCGCAGISGAMLSLQFASSALGVALIAALMGVIGWIAADAAAFVACVREFASNRLKEPLITAHGVKATLLVIYGCGLVLIQSLGLLYVLAEVFLSGVESYPVLSVARVAHFGAFAGIMIILCVATFAACSPILKRTGEHDIDRLWKAVGYANPLRWMPLFLVGLLQLLLELTTSLTKELHTSERAVYAVCSTLGTLGGYWVGKHFGLPAGAVAGGIIGLGIAWLDWKLLSVKFGWRQAT